MLDCRSVIAELGNYLDEDCAADLRRHLEAHFEHCPSCRVLVDSTRKTIRLVTDSGSFELPVDLSGKIMAKIREGGS